MNLLGKGTSSIDVCDTRNGTDNCLGLLCVEHDLDLFFQGGIPHGEFDDKAVELRFWQRIGAVLLDRVLRGQYHEGLAKLVRLTVDSYLALLHGLEQSRLRLGTGTVYLVGQNQVAHDATGPELKLTCLLVED